MNFLCLQISQKANQILPRFLSYEARVGFLVDLKTPKFHIEINWPLTIKSKWGAIQKGRPIFSQFFLHSPPQFLQSLVHTHLLAIFDKIFEPFTPSLNCGSQLWMVPRLCNTKVHRKYFFKKHGLPNSFKSVSI